MRDTHSTRVQLTDTLRNKIQEHAGLTTAAETERDAALERAIKAERDLVAANTACEKAYKWRDELIRSLQEAQNFSLEQAGQLYNYHAKVNEGDIKRAEER